MIRVFALTAAFALGGCGIAFTKGPPDYYEHTAPDCTTSRTPAYVDAGISLAFIVTSLVIGMVGTFEEDESKRDDLGAATVLTLLTGGAFSVSGIVGAKRVDRCKARIGMWRAERYSSNQ